MVLELSEAGSELWKKNGKNLEERKKQPFLFDFYFLFNYFGIFNF
jgi:hypothetical protein